MIRYEVVEIRRLEVEAEDPAHAMLIAALRLDGHADDPKYKGRVVKVPRVVDLYAKEI